MNKIVVKNKKILNALYKDSALTIEGLEPSDENLTEFLEWIKKYTKVNNEDVYIISGKFMNEAYYLTDSNAYPNDGCHLVCVKLSDMENPLALSIPRFSIGARWFDDIVANNAHRECEKGTVL